MHVTEPRGAPLQLPLDRLWLERIVERLELLAATSQARRL